jgi:hypothetical protein
VPCCSERWGALAPHREQKSADAAIGD